MSVKKNHRNVNALVLVLLALGLLWPVSSALATVGTTTLYQWQELGCTGGVTCPNWVHVSQIGAGEVTLAEGESLAHAVSVTGLAENTTYYFFIKAYLHKTGKCGYDTLVQYDYTTRLASTYTLLPGSGPRTPTGSLSTANGGVGGSMFTSGVTAVTVGAPSEQSDGSITSNFWPVTFTTTSGSTAAYFYFGLRLAVPNSPASALCTDQAGASSWDGGSLEASIEDKDLNGQYPGGQSTDTYVLTKDGPQKLVPSAIYVTLFRGQKWYDLDVDQNGPMTASPNTDANEPVLPGWAIRLYNCTDGSTCSSRTLLNTTFTDATGSYFSGRIFQQSDPRNLWYRVCEVLPTSWINSYPSLWGTDAEICGPPAQDSTTVGVLPHIQNFGNFQADWGDLPYGACGLPSNNCTYGTLRAGTPVQNGPYHVLYPNTSGNATDPPNTLATVRAIWLGTLVGGVPAIGAIDRETDGIPTVDANGDDINQTTNDEDGITLNSPLSWHAGVANGGSLTATFSSSASTTAFGCLVVWFDWNHDGDFGAYSGPNFVPDTNEMAVNSSVTAATSGTTWSQIFNITIPFCAGPDPNNCTPGTAPLDTPLYYRARLFDSCPVAPSPNGQAINGEVEDYRYAPTTAVELDRFEATGMKKAIKLSWKTAMEDQNAGFNIYRSTRADGERIKVQEVPSKVPPGSLLGAAYEWTDTTMRGARPYYYWLEDVSSGGAGLRSDSLHGPVEARAK